jgi:putative MATE family efflux protein
MTISKWLRPDLTRGTPWKVLLLFTLPIFLGNLVGMAYTLSDGVFLGWQSETVLSAVGAASQLVYPATIFGLGLPVGMANFTANLFGAKDIKGVRHSYGVSILLNLFRAIALTVIVVPLVPVLMKMGKIDAGTETYQMAQTYMYVILSGLIGVFFYNFFLNFLRAISDVETQFWLLGIYTGLNILLDYLFIVVAKWGAFGAALAYVLATLLISVIGFIWIYCKYPTLRLHKEDWKLDWPFVREHLRLGLPMALQYSVLAVGCVLMQGAVDSYGTAAINGYLIGSKIDNLLCTFMVAYGYAVGVYCAQNYGAKQYKRVKDGINQSCVIMVIDVAVLILVTYLVKDAACYMFLPNPSQETIDYCRIYLYWDIAGYLGLFMIYIGRSALQGVGKPLFPFLGGVGEFAARALGALVFVVPYGVVSALGAQSMAWILAGLIDLVGCLIFIYFNPLYRKNEDRPVEDPIVKTGLQ